MFAKKNFALIAIVAMLLMGLLAACGDATATPAPAQTGNSSANGVAASGDAGGLPAISGASTVDLPDVVKAQTSAYSAAVKNGKYQAYKTGDQSSKAQSNVVDSFKKAGWDDKSAMMGAAADQLKSSGMFMMMFQKGNKAAAVIGYPGSMAGAMGVGVGANETFFIVVSGEA